MRVEECGDVVCDLVGDEMVCGGGEILRKVFYVIWVRARRRRVVERGGVCVFGGNGVVGVVF